ncbi:MAG: response regulator [Bacteroidales bacterium]
MIYLIDDDKSVRQAFELFLRSAGLEFQSFKNANKFISVFRPGPNDILILDLNLPGMSGYDLLKKFKQDGILIPVIVVTAFDEPLSREYCKEYGVKEYLLKPVDGEALVEIIHKTIKN